MALIATEVHLVVYPIDLVLQENYGSLIDSDKMILWLYLSFNSQSVDYKHAQLINKTTFN